jgi:hypothetical protein
MRRAAAFLALLTLSACYSWQPVSSLVPQPGADPATMRVTLLDSSRVVIHDASLHATGVRGWVGFLGSRTLFVENRNQLQNVEVRQPDLESSVFVTAVVAVTTLLLLYRLRQ